MLGDALSRARHISGRILKAKINYVEVPFIKAEEVIGSYEEDQFFGPIVIAPQEKWLEDQVKKKQVELLVPMFRKEGKKLY